MSRISDVNRSTWRPNEPVRRRWLTNNGGSFLFGKHAGSSLGYVAENDASYLRWIIESVDDIDVGDRNFIEDAYENSDEAAIRDCAGDVPNFWD